MKSEPAITLPELTEALARLEHEQWQHWSQTVAPDASPEVRGRWENCWVPYDQLTETMKESDRVWARKVLDLLRQHHLIP